MRAVRLTILLMIVSPLLCGETPLIVNPDKSAAEVEPSLSAPVNVCTFPTELTVDGLLSLSNGNYPLQLGAFTRRSNAEALRNRIEKMLGVTVDIIAEGGLFKVRINNSESDAAAYYIPVEFPDDPVEKKNGHENTSRAQEEHSGGSEPVVITVPEMAIPEEAVTPVDTIFMGGNDTTTVKDVQKKQFRGLSDFNFFSGDNIWLKRYNYFGKPIALVNALIFTIIGCIATMLILLIFILLNRNRMEREERLRQYLLENYQGLIVDYLFGNATADKFRSIASDIYRRQVLIDQMIDVSVNLKGDAEAKLKKLYMDLNLDRDSVARARSRFWHKKIKGFRELAFMDIKEANDEIYKSLNARNEILRMEAQIALVRLSEGDPFEFLTQLKRPFSLWEQISLHELMVQHELPVPEFKKWLTSDNDTVVMFALRMIREFKQKEAEPEVLKVLLHREPRVSLLAVQVAGDLDMRSTLETMKRMYKFQDYNICLEIIRSMGKMPDMGMMSFLKLVLDKEDDVQLQIEATKAIENMGEEGVKALVKVMKSEYKNYSIIVRHVLDRRIY